MVKLVRVAPKKTLPNSAVHQFDSAVVAEQHAGGHVRDGRFRSCGNAAHTLKKLILLMRDSGLLRRELAELKEAAQLVAKLGQTAELRLIDGRRSNCASGRGCCSRARNGPRRAGKPHEIYRTTIGFQDCGSRSMKADLPRSMVSAIFKPKTRTPLSSSMPEMGRVFQAKAVTPS